MADLRLVLEARVREAKASALLSESHRSPPRPSFPFLLPVSCNFWLLQVLFLRPQLVTKILRRQS